VIGLLPVAFGARGHPLQGAKRREPWRPSPPVESALDTTFLMCVAIVTTGSPLINHGGGAVSIRRRLRARATGLRPAAMPVL